MRAWFMYRACCFKAGVVVGGGVGWGGGVVMTYSLPG